MAVTTVSSVSTTGTLSAAGVGSGLDVQGMVSKLMEVEQLPLTALATREAKYQAKLSSLGSIGGALSSLQTAAQSLSSASTVKYSASSSDSKTLTATATSSALAGIYSITVDKLAQAQKLLAAGTSSTSAAIGTGADTTLTFTFGAISSVLGPDADGYYSDAEFDPDTDKTAVTVSINSGNNTLAGIRDAINAADAGVTASIISDGSASPYRLTLTSNDTGLANSVKIDVSGDGDIALLLTYDPAGTQKLQQTRQAQDAALEIDGVDISSASNTVSEAIQGVTLTLIKETEAASPVNITVQRDSASLFSALSALVTAYNGANAAIASATGKGAVLQGDSGVLGLQRQVIAILGSVQNAGGTYTTLSSLGISFQRNGTLAFDTAKANTALTADSADVAALTAAIGEAIDDAATELLGSSGPISAETDGINRSIKDIASRRSNLEYRLELTQARYLKQFSALDTLISSMNATSSYLATQLDAIANLSKQSN